MTAYIVTIIGENYWAVLNSCGAVNYAVQGGSNYLKS